MDRVTGMHENRILVALKEIQEIALYHIPDCGTVNITEFYTDTEALCVTAGSILDRKSQLIEKVIAEMIDMLLGPDVAVEGVNDLGKPGSRAMKRRLDQRAHLILEADSLMHIYEQMLIEAQVKLVRSALEGMRKRLAVKMVSYGETKHEKINYPLFEADLILSIPDIIMTPSLDDIQKGLNTAVNHILCITKAVYRWGQIREQPHLPQDPAKSMYTRLDTRNHVPVQMSPDRTGLKNFHRLVCENKEIQKLASALSSAINSTKTLKNAAAHQFTKYSHLWTMERSVKMTEFMEEVKPTVNEFRTKMSNYSKLVDEISMEPEVLQAGPLALRTEKLLFALTTEAKAWVVCYGRTMSTKYQLVMDDVSSSINDWSKRLSRPLKDLDDIRSVMATLKEIREMEIQIDISIDPIEVRM